MKRDVRVLECHRRDWRYVSADGEVVGLVVRAGGWWWPSGMAWCDGWGFPSPEQAARKVIDEVLQ